MASHKVTINVRIANGEGVDALMKARFIVEEMSACDAREDLRRLLNIVRKNLICLTREVPSGQ